MKPKLTPIAACRVAKIDRDRLNEDIAAGFFCCAPSTTPGRARLFDPDDMIALVLYRQNQLDGMSRKVAGRIACEVASAARLHPNAATITFVETYFDEQGDGYAAPTSEVLSTDKWQTHDVNGTNVRKTTTFNIAYLRRMIAFRTEEERSIVGPED